MVTSSDPVTTLGIAVLVFGIAALYASVGHGGASGYLAVLSFFSIPPDEMASTALILNLLVAGLAFQTYRRAGYFRWNLTWPFIVLSVPAAFVGGLLKLPPYGYGAMLAVVLLFSAFRLLTASEAAHEKILDQLPTAKALFAGAGIGWLSGVVGIGGGIFLSPLMLLSRWANVKHTAATSALFIVVNALGGLAGRAARDGLLISDPWPFLTAGVLGGLLGSHFGARQLNEVFLKRVLAAVLLIAACKLMLVKPF